MAKKLTNEEVTEALNEVYAVKEILPLTAEFQREDLNALRDKLNEVIECLNSA